MDAFNFEIARLPRILFGAGRIADLPEVVAEFGPRTLIVTGGRSFREGPHWEPLLQALRRRGISWQEVRITDEPSPELIDAIVSHHRAWAPESVVAIGGGSVLDGAKAVAGLLPHSNSVMDHLEGVGRGIPYVGPSLPFIGVPTTAGTGSEATKNAVLSQRGPEGYKKSFRHEVLVPRVAIVDPELLATCPRERMAAQGMDAFTQLLESYVSTRANPFTEALAWSGMEAFRDGFWRALAGDTEGRARLAYASLLSGICLAQTGLGSVHGCASPLGAFFPIPHGVVCGTLVAEATEINIRALGEREPYSPALAKYARVGAMLADQRHIGDPSAALKGLVALLRDWVERLGIQRLGEYGMTEADIPRVVAQSGGNSMKTNPLVLTDTELTELLTRRI